MTMRILVLAAVVLAGCGFGAIRTPVPPANPVAVSAPSATVFADNGRYPVEALLRSYAQQTERFGKIRDSFKRQSPRTTTLPAFQESEHLLALWTGDRPGFVQVISDAYADTTQPVDGPIAALELKRQGGGTLSAYDAGHLAWLQWMKMNWANLREVPPELPSRFRQPGPAPRPLFTRTAAGGAR